MLARTWSWPNARPALIGAEGTAAADRWVKLLGVAVFGYAVAGRGFAYLGVPPVFVGEVVLAAGLALAAWEGSLGRGLALAPMKVLLALMLWVGARTVPFLGRYGVDAPRDAMIVGYGLYAVIIAGLLLAKPERLLVLVRSYRTLAVVVTVVGWVIYLIVRQVPNALPTWPWSIDTHIIEVKGGDLQVHLAAVTAFLVLGFWRARAWLLAFLVVSVGIGMIGNRGGMVAYLLAMGVLAVMKPPTAKFGKLAVVGLVLVALALLADTSDLRTNEGNRSISVEQIWANIESVVGASDDYMLNTTTEWRTSWWKQIIAYTFDGPYFWGGKGFGINLATDDGYRVDAEQTLRSPHNAHLTFLARGGVPAFVLWLLLLAGWYGSVGLAWLAARRARQARWMGVLTVCAVYCTAALANATFDVHLEGPMGGIPFWTFFGVGLAAARLCTLRPALLDELEEGPPEIAPDPPPAWGWTSATR